VAGVPDGSGSEREGRDDSENQRGLFQQVFLFSVAGPSPGRIPLLCNGLF
jgi:hypothetical protein